MNDKLKQLASKSGFVFWESEEWGPGSSYIDWGSEYDKEFVDYSKLFAAEIIEFIQAKITTLTQDEIDMIFSNFGLQNKIVESKAFSPAKDPVDLIS